MLLDWTIFLKTSDYTEEYRKDETCLQLKMNKYFIKTGKIYQNSNIALLIEKNIYIEYILCYVILMNI